MTWLLSACQSDVEALRPAPKTVSPQLAQPMQAQPATPLSTPGLTSTNNFSFAEPVEDLPVPCSSVGLLYHDDRLPCTLLLQAEDGNVMMVLTHDTQMEDYIIERPTKVALDYREVGPDEMRIPSPCLNLGFKVVEIECLTELR